MSGSRPTASIVLNGRQVEVQAGQNLVVAAAQHGVGIPHLCFHPGLATPGTCGLCVVDVETGGQRRTVKACRTSIIEGMEVWTDTSQLRQARADALGFVLAGRVPDCSTCEKAGECELQEYARLYGAAMCPESGEGTPQTPQLRAVGPHVGLRTDRCINCGRCVEFCRRVSGSHELQILGRGHQAAAGIAREKANNPLAGNLTDLCPTGALVDLHARGQVPAWRLTGVDSVCAGCSSGCSIRLDVHQDRLIRVRPRFNELVNGYWMCDRGRHGWRYIYAPDRRTVPLMRRDETLAEAAWDEAVDWVVDTVARRFGPDSTAVLASGHQTHEEAFLLGRLAVEIWRTQHVAVLAGARQGPDRRFGGGFLMRGERRPNVEGVRRMLVAAGAEPESADSVWKAIHRGRIRGALILLSAPTAEADPWLLAALRKLELLVVVEVVPTAFSAFAHVILPGLSAYEKDGTMSNASGHVQRLRAGMAGPPGVRSDWDTLQRLAGVGGTGWSFTHPRQIAGRIAAQAGASYLRPWMAPGDGRGARGQPFGGGWADWRRRAGLLGVADHTKRD